MLKYYHVETIYLYCNLHFAKSKHLPYIWMLTVEYSSSRVLYRVKSSLNFKTSFLSLEFNVKHMIYTVHLLTLFINQNQMAI